MEPPSSYTKIEDSSHLPEYELLDKDEKKTIEPLEIEPPPTEVVHVNQPYQYPKFFTFITILFILICLCEFYCFLITDSNKSPYIFAFGLIFSFLQIYSIGYKSIFGLYIFSAYYIIHIILFILFTDITCYIIIIYEIFKILGYAYLISVIKKKRQQ